MLRCGKKKDGSAVSRTNKGDRNLQGCDAVYKRHASICARSQYMCYELVQTSVKDNIERYVQMQYSPDPFARVMFMI